MKKWYLVYQSAVVGWSESVYKNINTVNTSLDIIIRKVRAVSKEEAIGKFLTETSTIEAKSKSEVIAFELKFLKTIK